MTGATSLRAVCLIGPSLPTSLPNTCVAALAYRPCVSAYASECSVFVCCGGGADHRFPGERTDKRKLGAVEGRGGRGWLNEHVKLSSACQLPLSVQYCFENHLAFGFARELVRVQWCVSFAFGANSVLILTGELPLYK